MTEIYAIYNKETKQNAVVFTDQNRSVQVNPIEEAILEMIRAGISTYGIKIFEPIAIKDRAYFPDKHVSMEHYFLYKKLFIEVLFSFLSPSIYEIKIK